MTRLDTTRFHDVEDDSVLAWSRHDPDTGDRVLVVALVEPDRVVETMVGLDLGALGLADESSFDVVDELTGERWTWHGWHNFVRFDPAERVARTCSGSRATERPSRDDAPTPSGTATRCSTRS